MIVILSSYCKIELTGNITICDGGIYFPSEPFFAIADTDNNAIDDAVSNPNQKQSIQGKIHTS